jgi:hypothetical protein
MTLEEIFAKDPAVLEMNRSDLENARNLIDRWLSGGEVDPGLAYRAGMLVLTVAERAG